jgi:hypothetical protein
MVEPLHPDYSIFDFQINDIYTGVITGYTITNGGFYSSAPTVTFAGCTGIPASATAILTGNSVTGLVFNAVGVGCSSPVAIFSPAGATATFTIAPDTAAQLVSSIDTLMDLATDSGTTPVYLRSLETNSYDQADRLAIDGLQFNMLSLPPTP